MALETPVTASWLSRNWFLAVAPVVVAADLGAARWGRWPDARVLEAGLLCDFAVLLPLLYLACYRRQARAAPVRALALACFAIWATGKALPAGPHPLLDSMGWLRNVGLAGLAMVEVRLGLAVYKAVVLSGKSRREAEKTLESGGVPSWLAKLMSLEAALWRRLWTLARHPFRKSK